jgi:tRNA dimethylallyltransferase
MLYFKAFFEGLDDMPAADPQVRAAIAQEAASQGWPALHAQLAEVDPATATRLEPQDSQRISRALEVWRVSGQPLSAFQTRASRPVTDTNHVLLSLEPSDRAWLHQRIAERFEHMLALGFLDEVRALMARGDLHAELPAMRCVGYRQAWQLLEQQALGTPLTALQTQELRDTGIAATRQLAKRQLTWLRSMPQRQVVQADDSQALAQLLNLVTQHWGAP